MGFRVPATSAVDQVARDAAAQAQAAADAAATAIIPGSRLAADAIDGKTITGATLRTAAAPSRRVEIAGGPDSFDRATWYTGLAGESAPGELVVTTANFGGASAGDVGVVYLTPPIIGTQITDPTQKAAPVLIAYGQTRDGTQQGYFEARGFWKFDGPSFEVDGPALLVQPKTYAQSGSGTTPIRGQDYVDQQDTATLNSALNSSARGLVGHNRSTTSVGSIAATAVRLAMGFTCQLVAGRAYRYLGDLRISTDTANTTCGTAGRITAGSTATPAVTDAAFVTRNITMAVATNPSAMTPVRTFQVSASGAYQINLWVNRTAGTGLITAQVQGIGDMFHCLEDVGPATSTVPTAI